MSHLFSMILWFVFFFKQKTAYDMRISDWSSDVCSSDLHLRTECGSALRLRQSRRWPQLQVSDRDVFTIGQRRGTFEDVLEFAHIAGKGVGLQRGQRGVIERRQLRQHHVASELDQHILGARRYVAGGAKKRGQIEREHV